MYNIVSKWPQMTNRYVIIKKTTTAGRRVEILSGIITYDKSRTPDKKKKKKEKKTVNLIGYSNIASHWPDYDYQSCSVE